jgi:hypothetical protein
VTAPAVSGEAGAKTMSPSPGGGSDEAEVVDPAGGTELVDVDATIVVVVAGGATVCCGPAHDESNPGLTCTPAHDE